MKNYTTMEIEPSKIQVIAERRNTMLFRYGENYIAVFRDRIRKFRNRLDSGETFWISVARVESPKWIEWFGVMPTDARELWKVTAVHTEKFTPIPHSLLISAMKTVLEEAGYENPQITTQYKKFRTYIVWDNGGTGIVVAHKNTAEKGIWVYAYAGSIYFPTTAIQRVVHKGNVEDVVARVVSALKQVLKEYDPQQAKELLKETLEQEWDRLTAELILASFLSSAPQYVRYYFTDMLRQKKIKVKDLYHALLKIMQEQERRKGNKTLMEKIAKTLQMIALMHGGKGQKTTANQ